MSAHRKISASNITIPHRKGSSISSGDDRKRSGGGGEEEFVGTQGLEMLNFLKAVITNAISSNVNCPKMINNLLLYFPAHATEDQVHDYYCVILKCVSDVLLTEVPRGKHPLSFINIVGVSGVMVNSLLNGMFVYQGVFDVLLFATNVLKTVNSTKANSVLGTGRHFGDCCGA